MYIRARPTATDREYLLHVFRTVAALPVAGKIFDERHNPLWPLGQDFRAPSGDAATRLLGLWQRIDPDSGTLAHDFTDSAWGTRFLGDLYQDLSESARKRYALLQTPEFVEEFPRRTFCRSSRKRRPPTSTRWRSATGFRISRAG